MIQLNRFQSKNLICLISKRTSNSSRSPFSSSLSLHFSSTSTNEKLGISSSVFDILVHKHHFPPELALRVASKSNHLKNPHKADSVVSFLKGAGFSNIQMERILKFRPRILAASVAERIKPNIKILQDLGISSHAITKLISSNPSILELSVENNIIPSLSVLKGLLESNSEVAKVISKCPWFLTSNFQNTVVPNFEFLKSCGVPMNRIRTILNAYPQCFAMKPENIRKCVEKAKEMGLNASSENFVYAIHPSIGSMSNEAWELKLQTFRDLGFSDSDILTMFRKAPQVLAVSTEKIKKIKELVLATGKFNLSSIVDYPWSFSASVEKRYKPRLQILGILESKNLIKKWPALSRIRALTDDEFSKEFINPYLDEINNVDIIKSFPGAKKR